jgi:putative hydrolase
VTDLPSGVSTAAAWSKAEWIEETADTWATLVEPIAEHVVGAMSKALPDEAKTMAGPLMGMLSQAGSAMFGSQIGQALGALAGEVLTSSDIGLPLTRSGKAALLPANVEAFAEGLDIALEDVYLYLALREAAHQRLFAHVPWLSAHLIAAVADYGRGIDIDMSRIEQAMSSIDPMNPMAMQQALEGGMFEPEQTPAQAAALARLETALALVEGWVDEVVAQAAGQRMPTAAKLQEIIRRRRAAGGPAEETFAALVGLELRPRRLRDAAALWGALRARDGAAARDAVWEHPDLMPTSADLDDPLGYQASRPADYFDAELARLLDGDLEASDDAAAEGDEPPAVPEDPDADQ